MKKYLIYSAVFITTCFIFLSCEKSNSTTKDNITQEAVASSKLKEHLIPAAEAQAMIKRYDEQVGSLIQSNFEKTNRDYINPTAVVHDIDALLEFLNRLKQNGNKEVTIRYAAIDGDGINSRIFGLPYHTLLFYANPSPTANTKETNLLGRDEEYFNHGSLKPPPPICCVEGCTIVHTHLGKCP
jgi:hypothetical protein